MVVLVGLVLALVALYFWLIGHWFARIVRLPVCAIVSGSLFWLVTCSRMAHPDIVGGNAIAILFGLMTAWWISGIPARHWRKREIVYNRAVRAAAGVR